MREQPTRLDDRRTYGPGVPPPSALPLTELEMNVFYERRFFRRNPRRSAAGWVANHLEITKAEVLAIEAAADAKLRAARPIVALPADTSSGLGYLLWRLNRLEHFALVGVHEHDDIREDGNLRIAENDRNDVAYDRTVPDHLRSYAEVLYVRARDRYENREEPSLSELEGRRWQRECELIELWGKTISVATLHLATDAYPTQLPLARAEAHLRWLAGEIQDLRVRAAARLGRSAELGDDA